MTDSSHRTLKELEFRMEVTGEQQQKKPHTTFQSPTHLCDALNDAIFIYMYVQNV